MCQKVLSAKQDIERADEPNRFAGGAFRKVLHTDRETGPDNPKPEQNNQKKGVQQMLFEKKEKKQSLRRKCSAKIRFLKTRTTARMTCAMP